MSGDGKTNIKIRIEKKSRDWKTNILNFTVNGNCNLLQKKAKKFSVLFFKKIIEKQRNLKKLVRKLLKVIIYKKWKIFNYAGKQLPIDWKTFLTTSKISSYKI